MATRAEIQKAVQDEDWQAFRRSLKGLPTKDKLMRLHTYYWLGPKEEEPVRRTRVDNYLKALARGGQVRLQGQFDSAFSHVTIRKEL